MAGIELCEPSHLLTGCTLSGHWSQEPEAGVKPKSPAGRHSYPAISFALLECLGLRLHLMDHDIREWRLGILFFLNSLGDSGKKKSSNLENMV